MFPPENPLTGQALDMSYAVLRSVSAMYTGYLKNMGTNSSMVMTLLKDGRPWGLIACHHHGGPKFTAYEVRTACELLANMTSSLILEKEELEFSDYKLALKTTQTILIEALSQHGDFAKVLIEGNPNLLDLLRSSGAAVVTEGKISLLGKTPPEQEVAALVDWLSCAVLDEVFSSDSISTAFPRAEKFREVASGVLACALQPPRETISCGSARR
jgi:two-component system, chemotaxis family, sensor kinase Cph1